MKLIVYMKASPSVCIKRIIHKSMRNTSISNFTEPHKACYIREDLEIMENCFNDIVFKKTSHNNKIFELDMDVYKTSIDCNREIILDVDKTAASLYELMTLLKLEVRGQSPRMAY